MSDIHGQFRAMKRILEYVNFSDNDTLYVLGDMIDRGKDSLKVLLYCMHRKNIKVIKGNHELMMQEALENGVHQNPDDVKIWYQNGGLVTDSGIKTREDAEKYYNYIKSLPSYFDIEVAGRKYLLVHAAISAPDISKGAKYDNLSTKNIVEYSEKNNYCFWGRDDWETIQTRKLYFPEHKIVHGHTPILTPVTWWDGVLNIDTGAGSNRKLSCYVPETNSIVECDIHKNEIKEYKI